MAKVKKQKDKRWSELSDDFMVGVANARTEAEVNSKIAEIAKAQAAVMDAKKADPDLADLREQLKTANEPYAIETKKNKQAIAFCREQLRSMGKDAGEFDAEQAQEDAANAAGPQPRV